MLPGASYAIFAEDRQGVAHEVAKELSVEPGETIDLGTIDVTSDKRPEPVRTKAAAAAAAVGPGGQVAAGTSDETVIAGRVSLPEGKSPAGLAAAKEEPISAKTEAGTTVTAKVTLPDGRPAAGADVAAIAHGTNRQRGGDVKRSQVLAEAKVDESGTARLTLGGVSSKTHTEGYLIARHEGFGLAWRPLDLDTHSVDATLKLAEEQKIRGRLIDVEGRPAAGARLNVWASCSRLPSGGSTCQPSCTTPTKITFPPPGRLPPRLTPKDDAQVCGLPVGLGAVVHCLGDERFAPQSLLLNTGAAEEPALDDGTPIKNAGPDEELLLTLSPAQWFEGQVTYADTGQGVPHAADDDLVQPAGIWRNALGGRPGRRRRALPHQSAAGLAFRH